MRFRFVQRFACSPAALVEVARRPACEAALVAASGLETFVEQVETLPDGTLRTRTRVTPKKELPRVIQAAVGIDRFRYVQSTDVSADGLVTSWRIEPLVLADRVQAAGSTRIVSAPGGCEQVFEGEIAVRARLVASTLEQGIVDDLGRGHARAAEVIRAFIGGTA